MGRARFNREDAGQTVVLVALMFTVLMGFAALGIDVGRFYSERRYLQDAVDAAALACARAYAQTGTPSGGWDAADALLQNRNLMGNPLGIDVTYPRPFGTALVYDGPVIPHNLISGILPVNTNGLGCRVAITVQVPTFLIKILSPALNTITMTTRGYAKSIGGFLPSVVKRWENGPGPGNDQPNQFIDHIMKEHFDYQCTITNPLPCTVAQSDPNWGREFVLFGQSAKATNDSSFRGYIALDIRDFTTTDGSGNLIHEQNEPGFFNRVDVTSSINILKDVEANWIDTGYMGPDLCAVEAGNFLPCGQLAVINGSSSGIFVENYEDRFQVGNKLLLQLYDGTVKTVPDFNIQSGTLTLPSGPSGSGTSTVQYTFSPQFAASGATVTTTLIPDNGTMTTDGGGTLLTNPFLNGCATMSTPAFSANPTLPNQSTYTQIWNTISVSNCDKGIYQAWLRGTSSAPYTSRVHETLVNINVGGQARDFSLGSSDAFVAINSPGDLADFVIRTTTANSGSTKWTGNNLLTLSWAKCPTFRDPITLIDDVLVCGIDGVIGATTVPNMDPGEDHTFNVQTLTALSGQVYKGWVRETGLDDVTNKRVTHLLEITLEVGVIPGGATQYADVLGFAVFEVTQINSNEVFGRAITGSYLNPNDEALAIGRKYGLVPWEQP